MKKHLLILPLISGLLLFTGCKVLLPAHPNSKALEGEKVAVNLITFSDATTNPIYQEIKWDTHNPTNRWATNSFENLYNTCFDKIKFNNPATLAGWHFVKSQDPQAKVILAAPLAAAAIGFAVDFVKKQMEAEAALYEAQFQNNASDDAFWVPSGSNYVQNYCGFEITRSVKNEPQAFRLICGIALSGDGNFFRIAPLFQQTKKAKAKVLGDGVLPTIFAPWIWGLKNPTHEIDTTVDLEMDGFWMDADNNSKFGKLASFPLKFNRIDLDKQTPYVTSGKSSKVSGWMISVPPSQNTKTNNCASLGVFSLSAMVTERDTSNAKNRMEQATKILGDNQQKIIAVVTNSIH